MGSPAGTAPDISVAWPLLTVAGAGVMLLVTALLLSTPSCGNADSFLALNRDNGNNER